MFNGGIALLAEYGENMQFDAYMNENREQAIYGIA